MKVDNECLRTSGKGEITEFLNYLSKSEENKQLPFKQIYSKNTLYNLKKILLKEKPNIAPIGSPNLKSLSSSTLN